MRGQRTVVLHPVYIIERYLGVAEVGLVALRLSVEVFEVDEDVLVHQRVSGEVVGSEGAAEGLDGAARGGG